MLTNLLNNFIITKLEEIKLTPARTAERDYCNEWTYCSDGSCSGDCVGGCDGTPAGGW